MDGTLWLETLCEHGAPIGPHDDHAGNNGIFLLPCQIPDHCRHPGHCPGGSRRRVTLNMQAMWEVLRAAGCSPKDGLCPDAFDAALVVEDV